MSLIKNSNLFSDIINSNQFMIKKLAIQIVSGVTLFAFDI